jgi:hypothetical protein
VSAIIAELEEESAQKLADLAAAEAAAKGRVDIVQKRIDADPTARLLMFARGARRPAVLYYAVVGVCAMLLGALLHAVSPQCLEGVKALIARFNRM